MHVIHTAIEGDKLVAHDKTQGWKIRVPNQTKYGVTPMLAFRQTKYLLEQMEEHARGTAENFNEILDRVKKMWTGEKFELSIVGFSIPEALVAEVEALVDGEEPPTLLHSIFISVKESSEQLDKFTMDDPTVTEQAAGAYLIAMQIQDGAYLD
jgi:hypothetical protein